MVGHASWAFFHAWHGASDAIHKLGRKDCRLTVQVSRKMMNHLSWLCGNRFKLILKNDKKWLEDEAICLKDVLQWNWWVYSTLRTSPWQRRTQRKHSRTKMVKKCVLRLRQCVSQASLLSQTNFDLSYNNVHPSRFLLSRSIGNNLIVCPF